MRKTWVFPVRGGGSYRNDWGGARSRVATGGTGRHQGTDIFAPQGTPVVAVEAGRVSKAGDSKIGGLRVWLNGRYYYAHLSKITVKAGQRVDPGDVIGYVGNTGDAAGTPPHLHFGFDPKGRHSAGNSWANPYPLLQAMEKRTRPPDEPPQPTQDESLTAAGAVPAPPEMFLPDMSAPPVGPGMVFPPAPTLPGSASIGFSSRRDVADTWQTLAALPGASGDTRVYAQLAALAAGDEVTA